MLERGVFTPLECNVVIFSRGLFGANSDGGNLQYRAEIEEVCESTNTWRI